MNTIITIGRQFGSGGREIGELLGKKYNIPVYDKELISEVSKKSGICEEMVKHHEERPTNSFLYNLVMDTYSWRYASGAYSDMPIGQKVFLAQFEHIKKLAKEGPCIFIGRCADYALSDYPNVCNIFILSDLDFRIKQIAKRFNISEAKAKDMIDKKDKQRQGYYNYYTDKKWGASESYDLCINSGKLGIEKTVELIQNYIQLNETGK